MRAGRRVRLASAGVLAALLVCPGGGGRAHAAAPPCDAWPMYQHDPSHSGTPCSSHIDASTAGSLTPRWFVPTSAVTATPSVHDGVAYAGDAAGVMRAIDVATGRVLWTFSVTANGVHPDRHATSYGEIVSSALVTAVPGRGTAVIFGGGGSVYALDAPTGAPLWATDLDPGQPASPLEVESSPVAVTSGSGTPTAIVVGDDTNEQTGVTPTGVVALNPQTGSLLWRFEASSGTVVDSLTAGEGTGDGCGDVWASPAFDAARSQIVFGTGNCNAAATGGPPPEELWSVDAATGAPRWSFVPPPNPYTLDNDFGSSPVLATVGATPVVVQAGKSGYMYEVEATTGRLIWASQVAQAGETGPALAGAIGGFIGTPALGMAGSTPALFASSAIPTPLTGDGITSSGASPDPSLAGDPQRATSVHAVDLATGRVLWQDVLEGPSYAPVTQSGGAVFAPSTLGFAVDVFDAATGAPIASWPAGGAPSSGVTLLDTAALFGDGTYQDGQTPLPPQATGVWCFVLP